MRDDATSIVVIARGAVGLQLCYMYGARAECPTVFHLFH